VDPDEKHLASFTEPKKFAELLRALDSRGGHQFILVTRNAQDCRGAGKPNPGGFHGATEVHAGLICLDSAHEMDLDLQQELFLHALNMLAELPDLINRVSKFARTKTD